MVKSHILIEHIFSLQGFHTGHVLTHVLNVDIYVCLHVTSCCLERRDFRNAFDSRIMKDIIYVVYMAHALPGVVHDSMQDQDRHTHTHRLEACAGHKYKKNHVQSECAVLF